MELAKRNGHTACVALLKEAMSQVSHGRSVVIVPTKQHQHVATNPSTKTNTWPPTRPPTFDHRPLITTPIRTLTTTTDSDPLLVNATITTRYTSLS